MNTYVSPLPLPPFKFTEREPSADRKPRPAAERGGAAPGTRLLPREAARTPNPVPAPCPADPSLPPRKRAVAEDSGGWDCAPPSTPGCPPARPPRAHLLPCPAGRPAPEQVHPRPPRPPPSAAPTRAPTLPSRPQRRPQPAAPSQPEQVQPRRAPAASTQTCSRASGKEPARRPRGGPGGGPGGAPGRQHSPRERGRLGRPLRRPRARSWALSPQPRSARAPAPPRAARRAPEEQGAAARLPGLRASGRSGRRGRAPGGRSGRRAAGGGGLCTCSLARPGDSGRPPPGPRGARARRCPPRGRGRAGGGGRTLGWPAGRCTRAGRGTRVCCPRAQTRAHTPLA